MCCNKIYYLYQKLKLDFINQIKFLFYNFTYITVGIKALCLLLSLSTSDSEITCIVISLEPDVVDL